MLTCRATVRWADFRLPVRTLLSVLIDLESWQTILLQAAPVRKPALDLSHGHPLPRRTLRPNGAGSGHRHRPRTRRPTRRHGLGTSVPTSRAEAKRLPGLGLREAAQSNLRPRLLLAPARPMSAGAIAQIPARVLGGKARGQQTARPSHASCAGPRRVAGPCRLGVPDGARSGRSDASIEGVS